GNRQLGKTGRLVPVKLGVSDQCGEGQRLEYSDKFVVGRRVSKFDTRRFEDQKLVKLRAYNGKPTRAVVIEKFVDFIDEYLFEFAVHGRQPQLPAPCEQLY